MQACLKTINVICPLKQYRRRGATPRANDRARYLSARWPTLIHQALLFLLKIATQHKYNWRTVQALLSFHFLYNYLDYSIENPSDNSRGPKCWLKLYQNVITLSVIFFKCSSPSTGEKSAPYKSWAQGQIIVSIKSPNRLFFFHVFLVCPKTNALLSAISLPLPPKHLSPCSRVLLSIVTLIRSGHLFLQAELEFTVRSSLPSRWARERQGPWGQTLYLKLNDWAEIHQA